MLKIKQIQNRLLRNNEHFQFMTEARDLMREEGISTDRFNLWQEYEQFISAYETEDSVINKIIKSAFTAKIETTNLFRINMFRGMADTNKAALRHYDNDVANDAYEYSRAACRTGESRERGKRVIKYVKVRYVLRQLTG